MTTEKAEQVLREFNAWRRYQGIVDGPDCPDPIEIGEAIDTAIRTLSRINRPIKPEKEYYGG